MRPSNRLRFALASCVVACVLGTVSGQSPTPSAQEEKEKKSEGLAIAPTRTIAFDTTEGTSMNLDVSPDGKTIVFDLLGDLYSVSIDGGSATRLTSGMGFDIQPAYSPDGRTIAFMTDRSGSDNLWAIDADGSNPRQLTKETERAVAGVTWSPDGDYLLTRRDGKLWMYHREGGDGLEAMKSEAGSRPFGALFSRDGRWIYFSAQPGGPPVGGGGMRQITGWQIRRFDRQTGDLGTVTASPVGAFRPVLSPDGAWMAYGVRLDAKTGLRLRNLESDEDDWLAYPIDRDNAERADTLDILPAYDFTPDGRAVIIATGGTFHRIDVKTRQDTPIAFQARVEQGLGPFVHAKVPMTTDPVKVRNIRYANSTSSSDAVVFAALNRIWSVDRRGGRPRAIAAQEVAQFQPILSPDGRNVAFVTWNDRTAGHLWRVPLSGGEPQRLTQHAAFYLHPVWSPDGSRLAFIKEDPAAARDVWSRNTGRIMWMAATGGRPEPVASAPSDNRLTFNADGTRLSYIAKVTTENRLEERPASSELTSVRLDGTDKKVIAKINAETYEAVPSPDGRWVAFSVREDIFVAALPATAEAPAIGEKRGPGPVKRVTREGGIDIHWEDGGQTLTWTFANKFFRMDRAKVMAPDPPAGKPADAAPEILTIDLEVPRHMPKGTVALRGATVVTMKGEEVLQNATIVVKDNRIVQVGRNVSIPAGTKVIDVSGKTITPGLIDMHAHLRPPRDVFVQHSWAYAANLAYGVTTTRDVSTSNDSFAYGEMVESGRLLGPRIFSTGRAMTPGNARIETAEDARAIVRHYKQLGTSVLKQYTQPHRRQRQWILQAAREEGLNITNEGEGDLRVDLTMVLDGYTGFEHSLPEANIYSDVIRLVAESKTWYTPTLVVSYGGPAADPWFAQTMNLHDDAKLARFTPHEILDNRRRGQFNHPDEYHFQAVARIAARILRQGGNVAMGAHGQQQGLCAHWELWAFQMGGMTNHEALRTATSIAAEGLGMADDLGTIAAGKLADLVVFDKNPLDNIRNSTTISLVMRNGELFAGQTLDMIWPSKVPFQPLRFREYAVPKKVTDTETAAPQGRAGRR